MPAPVATGTPLSCSALSRSVRSRFPRGSSRSRPVSSRLRSCFVPGPLCRCPSRGAVLSRCALSWSLSSLSSSLPDPTQFRWSFRQPPKGVSSSLSRCCLRCSRRFSRLPLSVRFAAGFAAGFAGAILLLAAGFAGAGGFVRVGLTTPARNPPSRTPPPPRTPPRGTADFVPRRHLCRRSQKHHDPIFCGSVFSTLFAGKLRPFFPAHGFGAGLVEERLGQIDHRDAEALGAGIFQIPWRRFFPWRRFLALGDTGLGDTGSSGGSALRPRKKAFSGWT